MCGNRLIKKLIDINSLIIKKLKKTLNEFSKVLVNTKIKRIAIKLYKKKTKLCFSPPILFLYLSFLSVSGKLQICTDRTDGS